MTEASSQLARQVVQLATMLSGNQVRALAAAIQRPASDNWSSRRFQMEAAVPQLHFRPLLDGLKTAWQATPAVSSASIALMLLTALDAIEQERARQQVDLVWTGPEPPDAALRRTDQALLEVIQAARTTLLLVSFAVYMTPTIATALVSAARRGVKVSICLDTADSGESISYDTIAALGEPVRQCSTLYIWPRHRRPPGPDGRSGSLHVKCAVADQEVLFASSANLTGYALTLNMELGVLIRGGPLPCQVAQHFKRLVELGVLVKAG
jgi:phosphatidylserine/phosphatidylglycerophosphate/cardiolipin synthase-like enzyme